MINAQHYVKLLCQLVDEEVEQIFQKRTGNVGSVVDRPNRATELLKSAERVCMKMFCMLLQGEQINVDKTLKFDDLKNFYYEKVKGGNDLSKLNLLKMLNSVHESCQASQNKLPNNLTSADKQKNLSMANMRTKCYAEIAFLAYENLADLALATNEFSMDNALVTECQNKIILKTKKCIFGSALMSMVDRALQNNRRQNYTNYCSILLKMAQQYTARDDNMVGDILKELLKSNRKDTIELDLQKFDTLKKQLCIFDEQNKMKMAIECYESPSLLTSTLQEIDVDDNTTFTCKVTYLKEKEGTVQYVFDCLKFNGRQLDECWSERLNRFKALAPGYKIIKVKPITEQEIAQIIKSAPQIVCYVQTASMGYGTSYRYNGVKKENPSRKRKATD